MTQTQAALPGHKASVEARHARIGAFVHRHFLWPGTLRLHRAALGIDILRAPVNVLLSPILVVIRIVGWLCRRLHLDRTGAWLLRRRILLRTAVSARLEAAILTELLDVPYRAAGTGPEPAEMADAILSAPRYREKIRSRGSVGAAQAMADRMATAINDYTGTRSAVAEFTTALITLTVGAIAFQALTPGMISMAPGVAEAVSRTTAITEFPLGSTLGGVWYGVFPVGPSPELILATVLILMAIGSVVAAFAGIVADPVQAWLGIHRRRLIRLWATWDAELDGDQGKPFAVQEHFLARLFDLWDAVVTVLRVFRG